MVWVSLFRFLKQSHCDPGCLGTHCVEQVSHVELRDVPAFASPSARIEGVRLTLALAFGFLDKAIVVPKSLCLN